MSKLFPSFTVRNIPIYYWLGIFLNGWFIMPNWVFYFRQHISQIEVGWVEGAAVLVGILMEVPSGALADLLGKKKTIIAGSLVIILGCLVLINAREFTNFLIGNILMFIGFSFQSGATEAFAYDSLKEKGKEQHYDTVVGKHTSISIVATLFSAFVGGFLYRLAPEAPFYAWMVFLSISVVLLLYTTEPRIDTQHFSGKVYLAHLKEGVKTLFSQRLRNYLIPILALPITIKLYEGLVRQSMPVILVTPGKHLAISLHSYQFPRSIYHSNTTSFASFGATKTFCFLACFHLCVRFLLPQLPIVISGARVYI